MSSNPARASIMPATPLGRVAKYDIVSYTDDDAVVDAYWLSAIGKNFEDPEVGCVTGLTCPYELGMRLAGILRAVRRNAARVLSAGTIARGRGTRIFHSDPGDLARA